MVTIESEILQKFADSGLSARITLSQPPKMELYKSDSPLLQVRTTGTNNFKTIENLLMKIEQIIEIQLLNKQKLL